MANIRVGNAPCSWGVVQGVEGEGYDWRRVLAEIAEAGFSGSELGDWGFMPNEPAGIREELARLDLSMIGAFTPLQLHDATQHARAEAVALRTALLLTAVSGDTAPFVILADDPGDATHRRQFAGRITPEHGLTDSGWEALASGVEAIARAIHDESGLRTAFHHHCGTFVETPAETKRLLDATDPSLVGLCLDTGHYFYAGGDPLELLREYRDRVWLVHFKDCDAALTAQAKAEGWDYVTAIRNGIFCGLGEGAIDHEEFFRDLERGGYDGWIVCENEAPPGRMPALAMAQQDRAYLRGLGI
jgi:inosose dehydratase